jgi:23S rRNA G2445 N2-methylase RlmL
MRYFATAIPGLHAVLAREVGGLPGVRIDSQREFDGRNDIVSFTAAGHNGILDLRTSEDVFVQVSTARKRGPLRSVVRELWNQRALEQALSTYSASVRPLRARMPFRVVTRVLSEREFLPTALRDELIRQVQQRRPRWRVADPAAIELWALETSPGRLRLGIRLSSSSMRHRAGRTVERPGALRPTVAAAMVLLADGRAAGRVLMDPCCGSGTILAEAATLGWEPVGADIDVEAISAARHNLGETARLLVADVRHLPLADDSVTAIASNLPFASSTPSRAIRGSGSTRCSQSSSA